MMDANDAGLRVTGASTRAPEGSGLRWLPLTALVIVVDQLVKLWVVADFMPYQSHPILAVLDLNLMYNTGAAWSFLADASGWQRWLFTALAVAVSIALLFWMRGLRSRTQALLSCSLALILGGAVGNMIDRMRTGRVVDFILAHWNNHYFPAFNVADSCITIGAALLLFDALRDAQAAKGSK